MIFATGFNGFLLNGFRLSNYSDSFTIYPFSYDRDPVPNSTYILAGWPTHLPYDSIGHIEFALEVFVPFLHKLRSLENIRVLSFGTCLEYNNTSSYLCSESDIVAPTCNLGASKVIVSDFLSSLTINSTHLRIFYPYSFSSPRTNSILWHLSRHLVTAPDLPFPCSHGLQYRDFFDVSLLYQLLSCYLRNDVTPFPSILNVCSGQPTLLRHLMRMYCQYLGVYCDFDYGFYPLPTYEPLHFYGSSDLLQSFINSTPAFSS